MSAVPTTVAMFQPAVWPNPNPHKMRKYALRRALTVGIAAQPLARDCVSAV